MRRIQQMRYMSLTSLKQTRVMITANIIDAGETRPAIDQQETASISIGS